MVSFFHRDLLEDILSRIPAKALLQWRLVSKSWRSLIDEILDPFTFLLLCQAPGHCSPAIARLRNHKRGEGKLARRFIGLEPTINFLPGSDSGPYNIVSSCNGRLLCHLRGTYCVCNPVTRIWAVLPEIPMKGPFMWLHALLAFDSHSYKVILLFNPGIGTGNQPSMAIYSSEEKKWGQPKPFPYRDLYHRFSGHLMNTVSNGSLYVYCRSVIIQIDMSRESYRAITLPDQGRKPDQEGFFHMGLLGGHLAYAELDGPQLKVWILEDDERWILKHKNNKAMATKFSSDRDVYCIKAFHPQVDIVVVQMGTTLSLYDMVSTKLEHVCELSVVFELPVNFSGGKWWMDIHPFSPCFLDGRGDQLCAE